MENVLLFSHLTAVKDSQGYWSQLPLWNDLGNKFDQGQVSMPTLARAFSSFTCFQPVATMCHAEPSMHGYLDVHTAFASQVLNVGAAAAVGNTSVLAVF